MVVTSLLSLPFRALARADLQYCDLGNSLNKWHKRDELLKTAFGSQQKLKWHLVFRYFKIIGGSL